LVLTEPQRRVLVTADGFPDVVIWNPWDRQGALLPDMAPTAFRRMLCVEAAVAGTLASVPPGGLWTGRQALILG
jgi:glucose-6-phosphate 1-epimerase